MITTGMDELKALFEGLGYTVQISETLSLPEMYTIVSQIEEDKYPFCIISFGDGIDTTKTERQMSGYIEITEDCFINTIYKADRKELPDVRQVEERKIRDSIFDYLLNDNNFICSWVVEKVRRAFLPGTAIDQNPVGGLGIQTKTKYRIKERS